MMRIGFFVFFVGACFAFPAVEEPLPPNTAAAAVPVAPGPIAPPQELPPRPEGQIQDGPIPEGHMHGAPPPQATPGGKPENSDLKTDASHWYSRSYYPYYYQKSYYPRSYSYYTYPSTYSYKYWTPYTSWW